MNTIELNRAAFDVELIKRGQVISVILKGDNPMELEFSNGSASRLAPGSLDASAKAETIKNAEIDYREGDYIQLIVVAGGDLRREPLLVLFGKNQNALAPLVQKKRSP